MATPPDDSAADDSPARIEAFGLRLPEVKPGDDLASLVVAAARHSGAAGGIAEGDAVVITSKVVSKSRNLLVKVGEIEASPRARRIAAAIGGDARKIQVILDHCDRVLLAFPVQRLRKKGLLALDEFAEAAETAAAAMERNPSMLLVSRRGQLYFDGGLDFSNHPEGVGSVPPEDPNLAARELRNEIRAVTGVKKLAVLVSDTELSLAGGSVDVARGAAGMEVIDRGMGRLDRFGRPKFGGMDNRAQEMAATAALLMGQSAEGIPAVLLRGATYESSETDGVGGWTRDPAAMRALLFSVARSTLRALGWRTFLRAVFRGR